MEKDGDSVFKNTKKAPSSSLTLLTAGKLNLITDVSVRNFNQKNFGRAPVFQVITMNRLVLSRSIDGERRNISTQTLQGMVDG